VEVGEEAADDAETIAGADEDAGLAGVRVEADSGVGFKGVGGGVVGAVLEGAGGGARGDDAALLAEGSVDGFGGGGGQR
jgi:hypothetical protein